MLQIWLCCYEELSGKIYRVRIKPQAPETAQVPFCPAVGAERQERCCDVETGRGLTQGLL